MLLVTVEMLEAQSQQSGLDAAQAEASIIAAQEIIRSELGQRAILEASDVAPKVRMRRGRDSIELPIGPILDISKFTALTVGTAAFDLDDLTLPHPWLIERTDGLQFAAGALVEMEYSAGFEVDSAGGGELPEELRRAILLLAGEIQASPNGQKVREKIGDWEVELRGVAGNQGDPDSLAIGQKVRLLIKNWAKPRL